jgi:hypothetical protein
MPAFLKQPPPKVAPPINYRSSWPSLLSAPRLRSSTSSISLFSSHPWKRRKSVRKRFELIGVGAGKKFDGKALSPDMRQATQEGMADAWANFNEVLVRVNKGEVTSGDLFDTRVFMKNDYLKRMAAAAIDTYGNTKKEAMYSAFTSIQTVRSSTAVRVTRFVFARAVATGQLILIADDV